MLRDLLIERGIGEKGGFRWRSHEVSRIEGLSDAVFGFAITLLVVSLDVPRDFTELANRMRGFVAFAISNVGRLAGARVRLDLCADRPRVRGAWVSHGAEPASRRRRGAGARRVLNGKVTEFRIQNQSFAFRQPRSWGNAG